uniref:NADH dehydrogenase subunit 3 n=1 Tax=Micrarionta opuntia TaxID=2914219 RepID=UPI001EF9DD64|nr:NADH dehydrogenase subunit 3 [Micrarionta opuntia]UKG20830.1 NADH dehydrogenase subunit 3 [Micrarionta opuntia]
MLCLLTCIVMLLLYFMISTYVSVPNFNKLSSFECGFESLNKMRRPFSVRYFILVLLFLLFDVETVLLFPCLNTLMVTSTSYTSLHLSVFVSLLLGGLIYEWYNALLEWA